MLQSISHRRYDGNEKVVHYIEMSALGRCPYCIKNILLLQKWEEKKNNDAELELISKVRVGTGVLIEEADPNNIFWWNLEELHDPIFTEIEDPENFSLQSHAIPSEQPHTKSINTSLKHSSWYNCVVYEMWK